MEGYVTANNTDLFTVGGYLFYFWQSVSLAEIFINPSIRIMSDPKSSNI